MYSIFDTPWNTAAKVQCLKDAGIQTIIRYYNNGNSHALPQKRLELAEAQVISNAGLQLAVIFQARQNKVEDFSFDQGHQTGTTAFDWAKNTIGQPLNSAIYFAVDYNAPDADIQNNIIPFFKGVHQAFNELSANSIEYKVGAYGSGLVCNTLKDQSLSDYRWLSDSSSFHGTKEALENGTYEMNQIYPPGKVCGLDVDYNLKNPSVSDIGSFTLNQSV